MRQKMLAAASIAAAALALGACGQGARETQTTDTTATDPAAPTAPSVNAGEAGAERVKMVSVTADDFVTQAARSNLLEVQSSTIAQTRASRPEIRQFAQMLVKDHTAATQELRTAAGARTVPFELGAAEQSLVQSLQNARADEFDQRYIDMQEDAHEKAVALFESYAREGDDPALQAFAAKQAPALRQHLTEVRNLRQNLNASSGEGGGAVGGDTSTSPAPSTPTNPTNVPSSPQNSPGADSTPPGGGATGGAAYGGPTPLTSPSDGSDYPGTATGGRTDSTIRSPAGGTSDTTTPTPAQPQGSQTPGR